MFRKRAAQPPSIPIVKLRPFEQRYAPYQETRPFWNELRDSVPAFQAQPSTREAVVGYAYGAGLIIIMLLGVLIVDHMLMPYVR